MFCFFKPRAKGFSALLISSIFLFTSCGGNSNSKDNTDTNNNIGVSHSAEQNYDIETYEKSIITPDIIIPKEKDGLHINEVLVGNSYTNYDSLTKEFSGWIELYNNGDRSINLKTYSLSDGKNSWNFPDQNILPHEYLLVWNDKTGVGLHTNFSLKMGGESIILKNQDSIIDDITFPKQKNDISFTTQDDLLYYMKPTPASKNREAFSALIRTKKPNFSLKSGFYNGDQQLVLTHKNRGEIFYTIDGSIPTESSKRYTKPISIDKTTVIRARALASNYLLSATKNRTYLINENITLPVISIGIDDRFLNDNEIGIYTKGTGISRPNYGYNWMRAGSIEYIKDGKSKFSENIGMRIHGATSRANHKKSLNIYAKDRYGPKTINYKLFSDKNINKFKSFVLRNSGDDGQKRTEMMKNALIHTIVKDNMDIDYQAYQPCVMFINGEYWGLYNIREKGNESYVENNHKIDRDDVDYIRIDSQKSDNISYNRLLESSDYAFLSSKIDIDEYINYIITQVYDANNDWPSVNNIAWHKKSTDGKWRWVLDDTDNGFGLRNYNSLEMILDISLAKDYPNPVWSTKLFRTLMQNINFKNKFISKFNTHLNTTFQPERINQIIDQMQQKIAPEVARDFDKWKYINPSEPWDSMVGYLYSFSNSRNSIIRDFLEKELNLTGNNIVNIPMSINGNIHIDDIKLTEDFSGDYFNNTTITLQAIPSSGYQFEQWSDGNREQTRRLNITMNISIRAEFSMYDAPKVVINEINYKSQKTFDTGDWIELYNNEGNDVDISGWMIKDNNDLNGFVIPNNTILGRGEYLIVTQKGNDFKKYQPNVSNIVGDFQFGISSKGDSIRIFNQNLALVDSVLFDESWLNAFKKGDTLSLIDSDHDNSQIQNWNIGENHGTPAEKN